MWRPNPFTDRLDFYEKGNPFTEDLELNGYKLYFDADSYFELGATSLTLYVHGNFVWDCDVTPAPTSGPLAGYSMGMLAGVTYS